MDVSIKYNMKKLSSLKITMNWKQAVLYEAAILSLGIIIGSQWSEFFTGLLKVALWTIFITAGGYIVMLWIDQNIKNRKNEDSE